MELNKNNLLVNEIAAKSSQRLELAAVYFRPGKTVATDSFTLLEVDTLGKKKSGPSYLVPAGEVKAVLKEKQAIDKEWLKLNNLKSSEYPGTDAIIPMAEPVAQVRLDAKKLKKLLTTITKMKLMGFDSIDISVFGGLEPVKIEAKTEEGQKVTALIMPIRK